MRGRAKNEIETILAEIRFYEQEYNFDELESQRLINLAKAHLKLPKYDKNQQKNCYEKAFAYLTNAIILTDYDPMIVIDRAELN